MAFLTLAENPRRRLPPRDRFGRFTKRRHNPGVELLAANPRRRVRRYRKRRNFELADNPRYRRRHNPRDGGMMLFSQQNIMNMVEVGIGIMFAQWVSSQVLASQQNPGPWVDTFVRGLTAAGIAMFSGASDEWESHLTQVANGALLATLFSAAKNVQFLNQNIPALHGVGGGFGPTFSYQGPAILNSVRIPVMPQTSSGADYVKKEVPIPATPRL